MYKGSHDSHVSSSRTLCGTLHCCLIIRGVVFVWPHYFLVFVVSVVCPANTVQCVHYLCPHQCHPSEVVGAACLAAGPAGHAGVTAATVLSEGGGEW